jgi:hypothetical protein
VHHSHTFAMFILLSVFSSNYVEGRSQEPRKFGSASIKGRVFRSDSGHGISNSYILFEQEKDSGTQAEHFGLRTDKDGNYRFIVIPAGKYTVSVYAWFLEKSNVPCQSAVEAKIADDGKVTVEWQRKSNAFMEIITIKGFSVGAGQERIKDFNLFCK